MENTSDNTWYGLALYSPHIDDAMLEDWVRAVLVDSGGVVAGVQLDHVSTSSAPSDRPGKRVPANEKSLNDVLKRSARGKVHFVFGMDIDISPNASLAGLEFLHLTLTVARIYSSETRSLLVTAPRRLFRQPDVVSYIRGLVQEFEVDYGFVAAGLTWGHIDATVDFTHSAHVEERVEMLGRDHPRNRFAREISFYQSRGHRFGECVPRASWANILSPAHVEALGGEDRIRLKSGAHLVERWGSNLYLQLTESLWDCGSEQLARLNEFLTPARFPDAPDAVYLDRESNAYTMF